MFGQELRYDHDQGAWYVWRGVWWEKDAKNQVVNFVTRSARERLLNALLAPSWAIRDEEKWARESEMRPRISACLELAKASPSLSTRTIDWNSDPMLLAVQNGVIDLREGKLISGRPEQHLRVHSPVSFDPAAACPTFSEFVQQITVEDQELIDYLQRAMGYSLTGENPEQIAFICHGRGSNGKSTLVFAMHELLGEDYATELPASILERGKKYGIPNDLMKLHGRRFATLSEIQENAALDESRFKQITGNDLISGRYLYKNFDIQFRAGAKLWLAFNHLPLVLDDTTAFWRRPQVISFKKIFTGDEVDDQLRGKLRAELPGILNWAVAGCLKYQRDGLQPPAAILTAVREYKSESNPVSRFVEESCECLPSANTSSRALFDAYEKWAKANEEPKFTPISFAKRLSNLGFKSARLGHDRVRGYSGIALRLESPLDNPADGRTDEDASAGEAIHYN